jgi:hypothetical protein
MSGMHRVLALVLALACGACGPVAYVHQVTFDADDAVAAARRAGADKYSPYWWTRATQYLHMARVVAAHADYQAANRFGRLAAEAAAKAEAEAQIGAQDPSKLPYLDLAKHPAVAPAKDQPAPAPAKDAPAPARDAPVPARDAPAADGDAAPPATTGAP